MPHRRLAASATAPYRPDARLADPDRLAALARTGLLDSPPDDSFDRVTRLAARTLGVPVALLSLIDDQRQFFKSAVGLDEPWATRREAPLSHSFCRVVVATRRPLVIGDARTDPPAQVNPVTADLGIVAYLGIPLLDASGAVLGCCCAIDRRPRAWSASDEATLADLAAMAMTEIEMLSSQAVLQERERRWHDLFDQIPYPAWVLDVESRRFLEVNAAAIAQYGYSMDEFRQRRLTDLRAPEQAATPFVAERRGTATGGLFRGERQHVLADGSIIPVRVTAHRFIYAGQLASLAIVEDISERQAVERVKDEFLGIVSHELRTPLTSIRAALGLLTQTAATVPEAARQQMLEIATRNADRLIGLVNDLLDTERLTTGRAQLMVEPCDIDELTQQAIDGLRSMAEEADITLSAGPTRLWAQADPGRIVQVLTNLIGNAIKFSPPGTTVQVGAAPEAAGELRLWVRDEGPGIAADQQQRIFDRFYQTNASTTRRQEGSGLGLAICRAIIEQHAGRIWVESTPGEGSTFVFTIPAAPEDAPLSPGSGDAG